MMDVGIVLFDAECVLCSTNARFILEHDKRAQFRLASVQGAAGAALCRAHGVDPADPTTILLIEGDRVLRDSDAVLGIYSGLGHPWRLLARAGRLVPKGLRDRVYWAVARNRYRLFGRRDSCWVAPAEFRARIL